MTKEHLLSKTLYGVDIIQHLIRKEYPDWKTRARVTPRAEEALTPDNFYN